MGTYFQKELQPALFWNSALSPAHPCQEVSHRVVFWVGNFRFATKCCSRTNIVQLFYLDCSSNTYYITLDRIDIRPFPRLLWLKNSRLYWDLQALAIRINSSLLATEWYAHCLEPRASWHPKNHKLAKWPSTASLQTAAFADLSIGDCGDSSCSRQVWNWYNQSLAVRAWGQWKADRVLLGLADAIAVVPSLYCLSMSLSFLVDLSNAFNFLEQLRYL